MNETENENTLISRELNETVTITEMKQQYYALTREIPITKN